MQQRVKKILYHACKWLGLFTLARYVTRKGLRILCYHGFALSDEVLFRPKLFIKPETFRKRVQHLRDQGYRVLPLSEAYVGLTSGELPDRAVVLTIDDGFYNVFHCARPILLENFLPATVYVTSYYAAKQNPIFRLVVQYILWKTTKTQIELSELGLPLPASLRTATEAEREKASWEIIGHCEVHCDEDKRCEVMQVLARQASVDYADLQQRRLLSLMSAEEIQRLSNEGIDIQLHTHRHCLPEDEALVKREITQNRNFLEPVSRNKLEHFCYPSGVWSRRHWPWLQSLGIKTATTCDSGLNYRDTPQLGLRRFLDGEYVSQIEFEAELSGFADFLRFTKSVVSKVWTNRSESTQPH